jgi:hypothetical protein
MEAVEILKKARGLLSQPGAWTRGWFAKDASGEPCQSNDPSAVCFCAFGAVNKFSSGPGLRDANNEATRALNDVVGADGTWKTFANFNDAQSTVEPVLAAFDAAIAKLEAGT